MRFMTVKIVFLENIRQGVEEMDEESLYIVIPAYNEEENIKAVIDNWYPVIEEIGETSRIVVINDGSRDSTYNILENLQLKYQQLIVLSKKNSGHGSTCTFGYKYALAKGADFIFQTDSDGQTVPDEIWGFWKQRKNFDLIIGWRKNRKDGFLRIIVSKVLKIFIRICFKVDVIDANTPFRLMKSATLKKYVSLIPEEYDLSNVLISVIYAKKGLSVKYIPITFRRRQGGVNSINLKKIIKIGKRAVKDFVNLNKVIEDAED